MGTMGLFNRKARAPKADPRADVADAMASLRLDLLDGPARAQKQLSELPPSEDGRTEWHERDSRRLELGLRASMELAKWAEHWVELEPGWAPPPATHTDSRQFASHFARALYQLTLDVPKSPSYQILTQQGADRDGQRHSLVCQELPKYVGGIGSPDWGNTRLHKSADARLKSAIVRGFQSRVPMWPEPADKRRGKVLSDVYGKAFFSWLCWSQDQSLLTAVSDQLPRSDDPRLGD